LITETGVSDMHRELFSDENDKENNTATFLRYMVEISKGVFNINSQKILHGDLKPANIILVEEGSRTLHPKIIDFDISLDHRKMSLLSPHLRYTEGYRAPWVKPMRRNAEQDSSKPPRYEMLIEFDELFREDTYALGQSIVLMMKHNENFLLNDDPIMMQLKSYIQKHILKSAKKGPELVPTSDDFYKFISSLVAQRGSSGGASQSVPHSGGIGTQKRSSVCTLCLMKNSHSGFVSKINKLNSLILEASKKSVGLEGTKGESLVLSKSEVPDVGIQQRKTSDIKTQKLDSPGKILGKILLYI
jgi:serine/threonine protein kinase